jgi:hypothetical protein
MQLVVSQLLVCKPTSLNSGMPCRIKIQHQGEPEGGFQQGSDTALIKFSDAVANAQFEKCDADNPALLIRTTGKLEFSRYVCLSIIREHV